LWIGSKFLAVIGNVTRLVAVLGGGAAGGGLLSTLGLIGAAVASLYYGFRIGGAGEGEDAELNRLRRAHGITGGPIADTAMDDTKKGFLDTLAGPESGGDYNVKNGGSKFQGYDQFPDGIGPGGTSTAAGRYQFTAGTWKEVAAQLGLHDFSPVNQDRGAWHLADTTYRQNTGRDLETDLQAGNQQQQIASALAKVWPSLPGGSQSSQGMEQFSGNLLRNLRPIPQAIPLDTSLRIGARARWGNSTTNTTNGPSDNSTSIQIQKLEVTVPKGDPKGVAAGIKQSLSDISFSNIANRGLA
jgi:muramidase (phage lysozyme)